MPSMLLGVPMRVDLNEAETTADALEERGFTNAAQTVRDLRYRVRELLSACAEVRGAHSHRQAVEAAQRGIAGDDQARIWTQAELDGSHHG